jgi:hypothetical protein
VGVGRRPQASRSHRYRSFQCGLLNVRVREVDQVVEVLNPDP